MNEWELTDEEIEQALAKDRSLYIPTGVAVYDEKVIAKAAQRKLVEWGDGACEGSRRSGHRGGRPRRECELCLLALRREVGIE